MFNIDRRMELAELIGIFPIVRILKFPDAINWEFLLNTNFLFVFFDTSFTERKNHLQFVKHDETQRSVTPMIYRSRVNEMQW